jgi:hypothetical protein
MMRRFRRRRVVAQSGAALLAIAIYFAWTSR